MNNKKVWVFAGIIVMILSFNHVFGWSSYISNMDNLGFLKQAVEVNLPYAIAIYMLLTIAGCAFLALPGVTFAIFAGLLFGPVLGTVCCSAATTIGAVLAFSAGRFFLKDTVRPMVVKNKYLNKWLFDNSGKNQLFVLIITRLVPVFPYNLQNFAYGITDIKFSTYMIGSLVFMLPGTAMYTVGTAGLADKENRLLYMGIAAVLAIGVLGMGVFLKRRYIQEEQDGR
ncbi:TVP38/TMEM64 family protein [Lacrimispora celerecrescens]|uniref:Putative membrane protein YdjX (TVP38/TMEM64 family) n=1 Tax=[Clostridium] celerecrescens 18A TaxID=1286362 RepID=A0A2M8Z6W2_9FIRM|nr:TVP38/TMEM64 family protein [Lacrimispora celerecrescens]PJJ29186.1 putative membrane protein YdjX (TVP38/TMEM64 family) [[Clostridium] celerecrescens 18A]